MSVAAREPTIEVNITGVANNSRTLMFTASNGVEQIDAASVWNNHATDTKKVYFAIRSSATLSGTCYPFAFASCTAQQSTSISQALGHKVPAGYTLQAYAESADLYATIGTTTGVG